MHSSLKQSNFENIFHEKLTLGDISACLLSGIEQVTISIDFRTDYYAEGHINESIQFAAFQTSRFAVALIKINDGCYTPLYTSYFWSDLFPDDWCSHEECFKQCIEILMSHPEAKHQNNTLLNVLKEHAQQISLLTEEE